MDSNKSVEDRQPGSLSRTNGQLTKAESAELRPVRPNANLANREESSLFTATNFGQSVVFQQSQVWSRAIIWGIMGITAALVAWACFARIEEAIPAQGKLEPLTDVKKVQSPISGVVKKVYVKNGDRVKAGDLLIQMESTVPESQLSSLASTKAALEQENSFYRSQLESKTSVVSVPKNANFSPSVLKSAEGRNSLIADIKAIDVELAGGNGNGVLSSDDQSRVRTNQDYQNRQILAGKLEIEQIEKQKSENRVKIQGIQTRIVSINGIMNSIQDGMASGKAKTASDLAQVDKQLAQNAARIKAAQQTLASNRSISKGLQPALAEGVISRVQAETQQQKVDANISELEQQSQERGRLQIEKQRLLSAANVDQQNQKQRLQEQQQQIRQAKSEIAQLNEEYERFNIGVKGGVNKTSQSVVGNQKDLKNRRKENAQRIADIDGQYNKSITENEKKITEISSQLTQAGQNLKYQEIRSPSDGTVFELKAFNEGTINGNSNEPVLQIVPENNLIAKVFITNKDIGFVRKNLDVDVRIDSFPFSEFGDVKGTLEWIGSDALPPDQTFPYYRFPARIKLKQEFLKVNQGGTSKDIPLQTGMSINANIKLRDRTVMSIFTEMFTRQSDSLKNVR